MSAPSGESPAGAIAVGAFTAWQAITEEGARAEMKAPTLSAFGGAQSQLKAKVRDPLADQKVVSVSTIPYRDQDVIRQIYLTAGTWQRPPIPAGKRIYKIGFAAINGGDGGNAGPSGSADGGANGLDGGYIYREYRDEDVPAEVSIWVASGGAGTTTAGAAGQPGGVSSCYVANVVVLAKGQSGTSSISALQGAVSSSCRPGAGGIGGGVADAAAAGSAGWVGNGQRGQSTVLAAGGAGGVGGFGATSGGNGADGAAASLDPQIMSGGGGGGGGGAHRGGWFDGAGRPGRGGNGGAPGGGGGGSGAGSEVGYGGARLPSGNGANGACTVWTYLEDIPT